MKNNENFVREREREREKLPVLRDFVGDLKSALLAVDSVDHTDFQWCKA